MNLSGRGREHFRSTAYAEYASASPSAQPPTKLGPKLAHPFNALLKVPALLDPISMRSCHKKAVVDAPKACSGAAAHQAPETKARCLSQQRHDRLASKALSPSMRETFRVHHLRFVHPSRTAEHPCRLLPSRAEHLMPKQASGTLP